MLHGKTGPADRELMRSLVGSYLLNSSINALRRADSEKCAGIVASEAAKLSTALAALESLDDPSLPLAPSSPKHDQEEK